MIPRFQLALRVLALACLLTALQFASTSPAARADEVAATEIAVTETVKLASGDTLTGVIVSRDADGLVMDHPSLGRIAIPAADIAVETPEPEARGIFGTRYLRGATRTVGVGLSGASGNSQNLGFNATLSIAQETERHRGKFDAVYLLASAENATTQNQFFTRYLHDFLFPGKKYFLYGNIRFDYDEFRDWDTRIALAAGAGYEFYKRDNWDLRGRLGFGFSKQSGSTLAADDDIVPEMQVALEFGWTITEGMTFGLTSAYIPDLADIAEFRSLTNLFYKVDIAAVSGLSLKAAMENEYISDSPTKKNDLKYIASLGYDF